MKTKFFLTLAVVVLASTAMLVAAGPPAGNGAITGKVTYTGTPPKMKPIDMSKEPSCAKQHATPVTTENVMTGPGNTLEDVVVFISAGDAGVAEPSGAARYDQKGCQYLPHVLPMQVGQQLQIYNDDQTSHNIHPLAKINQEWNKSQPPGIAAHRHEIGKARIHPGEVQYPSLDARLLRGVEHRTLFSHGPGRRF